LATTVADRTAKVTQRRSVTAWQSIPPRRHFNAGLSQAEIRKVGVAVRLHADTIWLSRRQMAELFDTERSIVTKHMRNIFDTGVLDRTSVSAFFAHTAVDGKDDHVELYNLDAACDLFAVDIAAGGKHGVLVNFLAPSIAGRIGVSAPQASTLAYIDGIEKHTARTWTTPSRCDIFTDGIQ
jgi:hypothetical protein